MAFGTGIDQADKALAMLDQFVAWSRALKTVRLRPSNEAEVR